jgi:GNAT superfamily N-acetyltransferase
MTEINVEKAKFSISTNKQLLNVAFVHSYLSQESYWAKGIPLHVVQRSVDNSLCFGVYHLGTQIGFARIITDFATVAYLGDVFISDQYRRLGLSKWLIETIQSHPELQGLRRWILLTADAHSLYQKYGWQNIASPDRWMERHFTNVYGQNP